MNTLHANSWTLAMATKVILPVANELEVEVDSSGECARTRKGHGDGDGLQEVGDGRRLEVTAACEGRLGGEGVLVLEARTGSGGSVGRAIHWPAELHAPVRDARRQTARQACLVGSSPVH
jgi:hypothetical protein